MYKFQTCTKIKGEDEECCQNIVRTTNCDGSVSVFFEKCKIFFSYPVFPLKVSDLVTSIIFMQKIKSSGLLKKFTKSLAYNGKTGLFINIPFTSHS